MRKYLGRYEKSTPVKNKMSNIKHYGYEIGDAHTNEQKPQLHAPEFYVIKTVHNSRTDWKKSVIQF